MTDPNLVLIRGLPGSGKSTLAQELVTMGYVHFEADMFLTVNGIYHFDFKQLELAHEWCEDQARAALTEGKNVVVSNVFCNSWSFFPYVDIAKSCGLKNIKIIHLTENWGDIRGTPIESIEAMSYGWNDNIFSISDLGIEILMTTSVADLLTGKFLAKDAVLPDHSSRRKAIDAVIEYATVNPRIERPDYPKIAHGAGLHEHAIVLAICELFQTDKIQRSQIVDAEFQGHHCDQFKMVMTSLDKYVTLREVREAMETLTGSTLDYVQSCITMHDLQNRKDHG